MSNYLLGIDIGTSSSKGVLVTADGVVVAAHIVPHGMNMPHPGWFEQDAEQVWWGDFVQICRQLLAQSGIAAQQIACIGISTTSPCVLPIDQEGRALRPGILYGIDTRASEEVRYLESVIGEDQLAERYKIKLSSQSAAAKILWLRKHEPEVWRKTHLIVGAAGYLLQQLTGDTAIDIYDAMAYAPLIDIQRHGWDDAMESLIAPISKLPRVTWTCEIAGKVNQHAAAVTGLAVGTPVITGTADAAAEAISAGLSQIGDLMVMYGSSIFFILKCARLHTSRIFSGSPFLEPNSFVVTGSMTTSGTLTKWFRDLFAPLEVAAQTEGGEDAYTALARLAAQSPIGANGLIALPHFAGARTPLFNPEAKGAFFGLTLRHTRADLYRALLESVGFGIRQNIEAMRTEGLHPNRILAVGGGTHNPLWMQIVSDIANIEQVIPSEQIGASYGDALLAGIGIGLLQDTGATTSWVKSKTVVKPNPSAHATYEPYYQLFCEFYEQTKESMVKLGRLVKEQL
ncbi:MAG: FGGY-family carbohydrate kinase [Caldilineaceae bacterium]